MGDFDLFILLMKPGFILFISLCIIEKNHINNIRQCIHAYNRSI